MALPDAVGFAGVAIILVAYASAALGRLNATSAVAHGMNFVGAALILVSLAFKPNPAAIVMESAWALVGLFGLLRAALKR